MLDNSFLMAKIAGLNLTGERHATLKSTLLAVWRPVAVWRGAVAKPVGCFSSKRHSRTTPKMSCREN